LRLPNSSISCVGAEKGPTPRRQSRRRRAPKSARSATDKIVDLSFDSPIGLRADKILACEEAGITVYLPKPMTSGINAKGRFGKQTLHRTPALAVHAVGLNGSPKRKLRH
jgi:hypothetical protein